MRLSLALALFALAGLLNIDHAAAQGGVTYPWCSATSGVGTECTHRSFSDCMYDIQGVGGWCIQNGAYDRNAPNGGGSNTQAPPPQ